MGAGVVVKPFVKEVRIKWVHTFNLLQIIYCKFNLFTVRCFNFTEFNGVINCSLGDDVVLSFEDTCNFTCNTGYELTGSDTRACQSDGNWSGSEVMCRRGD